MKERTKKKKKEEINTMNVAVNTVVNTANKLVKKNPLLIPRDGMALDQYHDKLAEKVWDIIFEIPEAITPTVEETQCQHINCKFMRYSRGTV